MWWGSGSFELGRGTHCLQLTCESTSSIAGARATMPGREKNGVFKPGILESEKLEGFGAVSPPWLNRDSNLDKRKKSKHIWRCEESNPEPMTMRCALLYQLTYIPKLYLICNIIIFKVNCIKLFPLWLSKCTIRSMNFFCYSIWVQQRPVGQTLPTWTRQLWKLDVKTCRKISPF